MNKEEILEKSRNEKNDEGMTAAENKGRKIGITAFCGVFIFIILFNWFNGHSNNAPMAMFWAFMAAEAYPKYKFTENRNNLIVTVAGATACICYLIAYILEVLW